jgi:hypothetical protein
MTVMLVSFAHKIPLKHFLHFSTFSLAEMAVESSPQGSNANNVLLGLNPALPNKFIVEFGEGLDDIVNQDRWVEVKFLGSCPSFFPRHAKARPEAAIHVPLAQPCLGHFPGHIYACLEFTGFLGPIYNCFTMRSIVHLGSCFLKKTKSPFQQQQVPANSIAFCHFEGIVFFLEVFWVSACMTCCRVAWRCPFFVGSS